MIQPLRPRSLALLTLALAAGAVAHGQNATRPPEIKHGMGFVLGQVVDVASKQPIAGAIVVLTGFGDQPGGVPRGPLAIAPVTDANLVASVPRRVITDSDGRFLFRELAGGRFTLTVTALGYVAGGYLQSKARGTTHFLDLGKDEKRGDLQIRLWKYASLGGAVVDEAGEPAVGATVSLFARTATAGRMRVTSRSSATTDDRGIYRLGSLMPGDYIVGIVTSQSTVPVATVQAYREAGEGSGPQGLLLELVNSGASVASGDGFRVGDFILTSSATKNAYVTPQPSADGKMLAYATTFFPNAPSTSQATTISLGSGEERSDINLAIRLVPTVRVSGTLSDNDGPAGNTGMVLLPMDIDDFAVERGSEVATTVSDSAGDFTFLSVPAGQYTIKTVRTTLDPATSPDGTQWAMAPVTVGATDVTGLSLKLRPGLRVSGRVQFVGTKPTPADTELGRMGVGLAALSPRPTVPFRPGLIDRDRQFTTGGYPPGKYVMNASVSGWTLASALLGNRDLADEPFDLDTADIDGVVITFVDKVGELSGTIVDARGAAMGTANVIVFPADSQTWRQGLFGPRRIRMIVGTKSGTYAVPGLPSGQYFVAAVDEATLGEWQDPKYLTRLQAQASRVTVVAGENQTLPLTLVAVK